MEETVFRDSKTVFQFGKDVSQHLKINEALQCVFFASLFIFLISENENLHHVHGGTSLVHHLQSKIG